MTNNDLNSVGVNLPIANAAKTPLVSVIVAVRNGERFLASALQSIVAQTYRRYETIVVDGESVDGTANIARSFAGVRCIPQSGRGISAAYNTGIAAAQGELLAFLSHDDLWTPDKLAVQVAFLGAHPEIQFTAANVKFFLEPGCGIPPGFRPELLEGQHVGRIMETLVARRGVFEQVGGFDTALTTAEDVDWFARANDAGILMAVLPSILLHKRIHDDNLSLNAASNNRHLLQAMRQSILRKRQQQPFPGTLIGERR